MSNFRERVHQFCIIKLMKLMKSNYQKIIIYLYLKAGKSFRGQSEITQQRQWITSEQIWERDFMRSCFGTFSYAMMKPIAFIGKQDWPQEMYTFYICITIWVVIELGSGQPPEATFKCSGIRRRVWNRTLSRFLHIFAIAVDWLTFFCKIRKFPYDFSQF